MAWISSCWRAMMRSISAFSLSSCLSRARSPGSSPPYLLRHNATVLGCTPWRPATSVAVAPASSSLTMLTTGPYLGYSAGIGIVNGAGAAAIAGPPCPAADLDLALHVGIGYSMPKLVASVINFFLRAVHLSQIKPFGGPSYRVPLKHLHEARPLNCA